MGQVRLTLALSLRSCMEGSLMDLPEANLVQLIKSPSAEATSLTALEKKYCWLDRLRVRFATPHQILELDYFKQIGASI